MNINNNKVLIKDNLFNISFLAVLGYIIVQYMRPQDWIAALEYLQLGMIIQIVCFFALLKNMPNKLSRLSILLILFLIIMAISIPFAYNNFYAYRETKTFAYMLFGGLFPMMVCVDSYPRMKAIFGLFIIIVIGHASVGIVHGKSVGGFMGEENDLALLLNIAIPISFFLVSSATSTTWKTILILSISLLTLSNAATLSRGGFLGLVAVGLYCFYKSKRRVAATVIIVMAIGCLAIMAPAQYWDEMATIKNAHVEGETGEERLFLWKIAWRMFLENPIMGVGAGNFPATVDFYYLAEDKRERGGLWHGVSYWGRSCHSTYFTLMSELGVTGTIVFICIVWVVWKNMTYIEKSKDGSGRKMESADNFISGERENYYSFALAVKGGLIGFLSTGAFLSVLYYPNLWTLVAMSEIVRQNYENTNINKQCHKVNRKK